MARPSPPFRLLSAGKALVLAVALVAALGGAIAAKPKKVSTDLINGPLLTSKIAARRTLVVGPEDEFKTVQAAVDTVPAGNSQWVIIHLRAGLYREKVVIPEDKPFIYLRGNGKGRTAIQWDDICANNSGSATFTVSADNVVIFGISFRNGAHAGQVDSPAFRTVAAMVAGDKVAFYHCAFYSPHNTLFDHQGRHYYESCYIQGNIDFIFGSGQSMFQSCEVFVLPDRRTKILGSITAQNRKSEDTSGFVFLKSKVYGVGEVFLGRANEAYSRVLFAGTYLSKTITPAGWTNWSYSGSTNNLLLGEHDCFGPGADPSQRVKWARQLSQEQAAEFLTVDFIDGKDWLPAYYY